MTTPLFDARTRRKLEQLMLVANRVRTGAVQGERRSAKRGTSIEFADHRPYVPGDDLRHLDWKIYARTGRPFVKLFEDEQDLAVHLILDTSKSMDFPPDSDDTHKLTYARRLLGGLALIALASNDRLTLTGAADDRVRTFGPARGRPYTAPMLAFVGKLDGGGSLDFNRVLASLAARERRAGLVIIISDMMHAGGYLDGVAALVGRGSEVVVMHTLAPEEIAPTLHGDLRLIDAETNTPQEVTVDGALREVYARRLSAWRAEMSASLRRRGVHYLPIDTATPFDRVILAEMRRLGIVR